MLFVVTVKQNILVASHVYATVRSTFRKPSYCTITVKKLFCTVPQKITCFCIMASMSKTGTAAQPESPMIDAPSPPMPIATAGSNEGATAAMADPEQEQECFFCSVPSKTTEFQ